MGVTARQKREHVEHCVTQSQEQEMGLPLGQLPVRGLEWNVEARQERGGPQAVGQGPSS